MSGFETAGFREAFRDLLAWRRDVRSFRSEPLPEPLIDELLQVAALAPSVGLSQPWRFVRLLSDGSRAAVRENFQRCNAAAIDGYEGDEAARYARLKLSGLDQAPVQIAAFCDRGVTTGGGLGRQTMPETLDFSVVMALHGIWLMARAHGVAMGWTSIIDPDAVAIDLSVPADWRLIAILCLGRPAEVAKTPELERLGWERRAVAPVRALER